VIDNKQQEYSVLVQHYSNVSTSTSLTANDERVRLYYMYIKYMTDVVWSVYMPLFWPIFFHLHVYIEPFSPKLYIFALIILPTLLETELYSQISYEFFRS